MPQTFNFTDASPASASSCKLHAVNAVLRANGLNQVAALQTGQASYAGIIEQMLDEENKRIQMRRWNFNTFVDVELTPDGSDNISAPNGTLFIKAYGTSRQMNITNKNGTLYDLENRTDEFSAPIKVEYTALVTNFDEMPSWFCDYVAATVAERFNEERMPEKERPHRRRFLREAWLEAKRTAENNDGDESGFSVLETHGAYRVRGRRYTPLR